MNEESIFAAALEKPLAERAPFLDGACGEDTALRQRVEDLLAAHAEAGAFLDKPAEGNCTGAYESARENRSEEQVGRVIAGKYKLLQRIGEGGMGAVYMADQTHPVKRRVAVKVIKAGMDSARVLARFEAERQALALMDHPNIAKVLEAGATETNQPYFVMELVKGIPLTEFCDQHKLPMLDRLNLFQQICSAVQHAHQKGIIHRDLKPTNILVESHDGKPVPKVIDFGLAKATSGVPLTDHTMFTALGQVAGTPLYMAPEQAAFNAIDVDTRADIYALGVILYELLTGTTPIERSTFKKAAFDEILRVVREQEPPTPSSRLSSSDTRASVAAVRGMEPAKLGRFVKGELDWIVMKALSKERDRRYETANGFAKDIERFLNHEPVQAGPPSVRYKARKFVQRNRPQVIAGSLVLLALIGGIIGTTVGLLLEHQAKLREAAQLTIAIEQRGKAEKARDRTRDVLDAMTSEVTGDSLSSQKAITEEQKKFLTEVLTYYKEFAGENADDERSRERTAEAAYKVALIQYRLGHQEESIAAFRAACDGLAALAADFPAVQGYRRNLAHSHNNLGILLVELGKRTEAESEYNQAVTIQEKLVADYPTVPGARHDLADSYCGRGIVFAHLKKLAEAEGQLRAALLIQEKLFADFPADSEYRHRLALSHHNLGTILMDCGKRTEAESEYRKALVIQENLVTDFPAVANYRHELSDTCDSLGLVFAGLGKRAEAEIEYRKALVIREKLVADFPAIPAYRNSLAESHHSLGMALAALGKSVKAEDEYRQALAIREKLAADFPAVPANRFNLATSHNSLGLIFADLAKWTEAEGEYCKAQIIQEKLAADFPTLPVYRDELAGTHNNLGIVFETVGKRPQAELEFRKALAMREKLAAEFPGVPKYQIDFGGSYCDVGRLIRDQGKLPESLPWFGLAIQTLKLVHEKEPRDITAKLFLRDSYWSRATAYDRLEKFADAVKDWDSAIELSPPREQPQLRAARATSRVQVGQVAEAIADIAALAKLSGWNASHWYDFACVYAVASGKIAEKKQEYADRAMDLLQKAVKAGYKDAAHMKKDTDLDPLREREDFKKLLAELIAKSSGKPMP